MELVYLWVQDYKNIHEEGFNFSPRFTCKYENNELTITPKDPEPVSIFPSNINITAIVGENGSGKSGLLELVFMPHQINNNSPYKYILFFIDKEKIINYYVSYSNDFNIEIKNYNKKQLSDFDKHRINTKLISSLLKTHYDHYVRNKVAQTNEHYLGNMSYEASIVIKSLKLFQSENYISLKEKNINFQKLKMTISLISLEESVKDEDDIEKKYNKFIKNSIPNFEKKFDTLLKLPTLENLIKNNLIAGLLNYFPKEKTTYIEDIFTEEYSNVDIDKIISCINPEEDTDICALIDLSKKLLEKMEKIEFSIVKNGDQEVGYEYIFDISKDEGFLKSFIKDFDVFIKRYSESYFEFQMINIDMLSDNNLSLLNLSDGEKNLYSKLVDIKYEFLYKKGNYFLLLDEPDNFLHPNWTKEFISILLDNIPSDLKNKKVYFIITSHSPFILSDLPKENVIFLKKDEDGNCKNVTEETNIETFGANIHTLLSHGFFMKDGLMGEFAKSKINKAIEYLNKIKLEPHEIKYCEKIISIIGEPIVKMQLQRMLDSKKLDKMKEIDALKNQIESLKNRLDILVQND